MTLKTLGMGIAKVITGGAKIVGKTKSDFRLKNKLKKIQKTPNKEFTKVNLKMPEDGSTVKGKVGKKNYSKETRRYHQAHKRMGLIKD
tara:strand:+ start:61 stop:324 length:264 start_codon:yes stop_codon:yes gene_type:complete